MDAELILAFREEIEKLGRTDKERAEALGVKTKTVERYKQFGPPATFVRMVNYPNLVDVARRFPRPSPRKARPKDEQAA